MRCGNKTEKMAKGGKAKPTRPGSSAGTKAFAKGGSVRGTGCATKGTSFKGAF